MRIRPTILFLEIIVTSLLFAQEESVAQQVDAVKSSVETIEPKTGGRIYTNNTKGRHSNRKTEKSRSIGNGGSLSSVGTLG